ncbi:unnamed protein product [Phytomonas sp. EM1]|nr:unnamed protein product [Phytomonas sp. EM1]|eukprot:CCW60912.1 unnamed protein product [Phytomonas sp. isolate EM1]
MLAYEKLESLFTTIYRLNHVTALCHWDMNTYMPPEGEEARGEAIATIKKIEFQHITAPDVKKWIDESTAAQDKLSAIQRANLREMTLIWKNMNFLSEDFISRKAKLTTMAHSVWKKSRNENKFSDFIPVLKEIVLLAREEGSRLAVDSSLTPYEALLNIYEPGITIARLNEIFGQIKSWLPQLLRDIVKKQESMQKSIIPLKGPFPVDKQEALCKDMMHLWKFDFKSGRLDVSPHPFTGMCKEDCRITTVYSEEDPLNSLHAVIHEVGHAKYEQNLGPRELITQPVCNARSLGVHESQSLFAEFQLSRARPFIQFLQPKFMRYLGEQPGFAVENIINIIRTVKPGYIRVAADEVSYPLHIILRYEIERDLVDGTLQVEDVPRVWNEKMKEYLGLETTGRDDLGCLQDIHWSLGSMGYFPTYSLGALLAAQLMATIRKELGEDTILNCLQTGNLDPILAKQKEKIWDHGCLYPTEELVVRATGERLNPEYLHEHLVSRYLKDMN